MLPFLFSRPSLELMPPPSPRFETRLKDALSRPLPGIEVQRRYAPKPRGPLLRLHREEDAVPAGVLAVLHPSAHDASPLLVLTRRSADLPWHAGQISLPGGRLEPGETAREAALREAEEEIGLHRSVPTVLGALTPVFVPVSGFLLHPFVAVVESEPALVPSLGEVDAILHVPIAQLADPGAWQRRVERRGDVDVEIPFHPLGETPLWGATAMIVGELVALLAPGGSGSPPVML